MNLERLESRARRLSLVTRLERWAISHPVLFIFVAALTLRVMLAVVLTVSVGMEQFSDAKNFSRLAFWSIRSLALLPVV